MGNLVGVGFLLFALKDGQVKLFVVEELTSKPAILKEAGMVSFPLETYEERDGSHFQTVVRLIDEEMGIPREQVTIYDIFPRAFQGIHGREDIIVFYGYGIFTGDADENFCPNDPEVSFAGWKTITDLLACHKQRVEVGPILSHFVSSGAYGTLLGRFSPVAA